MNGVLGLVVLALAATSVHCSYIIGAVNKPDTQVHVINQWFFLEDGSMKLRYVIKFPDVSPEKTYVMLFMGNAEELWPGDYDCAPSSAKMWNITLDASLDACNVKDYMVVCDGWEYIEWETTKPQMFMLVRCDEPYLNGVTYELADTDFQTVSHANAPAVISIFTLGLASLLAYLTPW